LLVAAMETGVPQLRQKRAFGSSGILHVVQFIKNHLLLLLV
jgi:hypothetical protein